MLDRRVVFVITLTIYLLSACAPTPPPTSAPTVTPVVAATAIPPPPTGTAVPATDTPAPTRTPIPPTATSTAVPSPAPLAGLRAETSAAWNEFVASIRQVDAPTAQARVDEFWADVTANRRVPLPLQDGALLLYKGDARSVTWRGDFSFWQFGKGIEGTRVGDTDLWYAIAAFPRDSRTEYQIVLDGSRWILDPANPDKQRRGKEYNSILTMPEFKVTDETERRAGVPAGTLTEWTTLESKEWGGPVNYRVYTPANYDALNALPVLYVTDGSDFSDERMGAMPVVLDNLIAASDSDLRSESERIRPVIAVFIDARNPDNLDQNQRNTQFLARPEDFARLIANELVPEMDAQYRTDASPAGRGIAGTSYGGVFATYAALQYPEVFGNLAAFSPAYWVLNNPAGTGSAATAAGAERMSAFISHALQCKTSDVPCPAAPLKIWMSTGIEDWDVGDLAFMADPLRALGHSVTVMHVQEGHSWSAWSGETDEMLQALYGVGATP